MAILCGSKLRYLTMDKTKPGRIFAHTTFDLSEKNVYFFTKRI